MYTPRSPNAAPSPTQFEKLLRTTKDIDGVSWSSMLAILLGWFFMDTLVVSLGSLQRGVRFFDISAAIADPTRIFFGVETSPQRFLFGLVCLASLLAPLLAHWRKTSVGWLAYLAPLTLMAVCGALLYSKTSSEFFAAPSAAGSAGAGVVGFANDLLHKGSGLVSRHISVGVGGYLAFAASVLLAVRGIRR